MKSVDQAGQERNYEKTTIGSSSGTMQWNNAVESESSSSLRAWESYEASVMSYYVDKPSREGVRPKKFQMTYTAERKFEVREFAFSNPEYSYQQVANAFKMPKTTVFDIIKCNSSGEPAKGRGNKKGAGQRLSYSKETDDIIPTEAAEGEKEWKIS